MRAPRARACAVLAGIATLPAGVRSQGTLTSSDSTPSTIQPPSYIGTQIDSNTAALVLPYARMSEDSYCPPCSPATLSADSADVAASGFHRIEDWQQLFRNAGYSEFQISTIGGSGFYAALYKNDLTGELTIAFRGTVLSKIPDDMTDLSASFGIKSLQYQAASNLTRIVKQQFPEDSLSLTGHSLGGALATYASQQNKISYVVTFDAARTDSRPRATTQAR